MIKKYKKRIDYVYYLFLLSFFVVAVRIIYLQVFHKNFLDNLSRNQYYCMLPLRGERGQMLDRRGRIMARSLNCYSIFADPSMIGDVNLSSARMAVLLGEKKNAIWRKLSKKTRFVWLRRKVSFAEKEKVKGANVRGVGFIREEKRFYPQENIAGSFLGLVDIDNNGLEGLELVYDSYLRGKEGLVRVLQDSTAQRIILSPNIIAPEPGAKIVLTIDSQIQYWAQEALRETVDEYGAASASIVVMTADTGEVLALAQYPDFNPNKRTEINPARLRNKAITDIFEPGSVFKIVTLVAAIDQGLFDDSDIVFCEKGAWKIPGTVLHDWKPYGELTFTEVFKKSSNIGVAKIAEKLGSKKLYHYMRAMGFGEKSGIDLVGETPGIIKTLQHWSNTSPYIMPIGQEVGVNLMQLARAMAVVANGGYLVKPHMVKRIIFSASADEINPEPRRIIPERVAARAKSILVSVVEDGTGKRAAVGGLTIGGKTGTAQKYDAKRGHYSDSDYRASFIGFIASESPLVMAISLDEPRKHHFGGVVAAPVFSKIAKKLAVYWVGNDL